MVRNIRGVLMNGRLTVGVVCAAVLGASVTAQQRTHLNPMVDLLIAKKAIFGLSVPTAGRGGGGGNRGGAPGAAGAVGGVTTAPAPAPTSPPVPPKTPVELAADAMAHPEADYFF